VIASLKRREFITLLGGAAAAWPLAARAQQRRRVALLIANYAKTDHEGQACVAAFLDTFQKLGWRDGRDVRLEYRWGAGDAERAKAAAAELVGSAPDVIVVATTPALAELHRLTSTIPIVFIQVGDPVESGLVASLAHPGGNITGFQSFDVAIGGKWLGLLKEAAPNMMRDGLGAPRGPHADARPRADASRIFLSSGGTDARPHVRIEGPSRDDAAPERAW
jgi:putative ABC transport system substrate-binding protein